MGVAAIVSPRCRRIAVACAHAQGHLALGAELDSLGRPSSIGVAPALILYFWSLHELGNAG